MKMVPFLHVVDWDNGMGLIRGRDTLNEIDVRDDNGLSQRGKQGEIYKEKVHLRFSASADRFRPWVIYIW
jgi:hypothetical protein